MFFSIYFSNSFLFTSLFLPTFNTNGHRGSLSRDSILLIPILEYSAASVIDNVIVNTENVSDIYVKYFQYAGISIFQCNKENAEMYMLVMNCKNGKAETISFSSIEELEKYRNIIENSIANLKSSQMIIG